MSEPPTLLLGDCFEVLQTLEAESVDACVTDPPYGLSFMGKHWDRGVPATDVWEQVYRVLKPGAHLLSFFGTRTYHRGVVAIEDAGFEIRDQIGWLYGSGFPKSLDVSKAIDKAAPRVGMFDAFAAHFSERLRASGKAQKEVAALFPSRTGGLTGCVWNWANGANVPTLEQWKTLQPLLELSLEWLPLIERIEAEREVTGTKAGTFPKAHMNAATFADNYDPSRKVLDITAPATEAAKQWEGWGTALAPAWEPIVVARKPLIGTVATNILTHGTGGLNINDCRVMTGQLPSWESDQNLCSSCAARVASEPKPTTPETRASTATGDAGQTTSARDETSQPGTSKTATGCSDGTKAGDTATSLSTAASGKTPTDPSQQGTKSTTSTKTAQTTGSKTCASCSKPITSQSTGASTTAEQRSLLQEPGRLGNTASANAPAGRWPKNVIHDGSDEVLAEFAKYGESKSSGGRGPASQRTALAGDVYGSYSGDTLGANADGLGDTGTAARFFYTAKASKDDRNDGLHDYEHTDAADMVDREPDSAGMNSPRAGAGRTSGAKNQHPTVKPTSLMRYLVRLVCPKGGLVLDPFAGSGTTLIAAYREDCRAVGIELDPDYFKMASHRIDKATAQLRLEL